jgi:hypothetical protein
MERLYPVNGSTGSIQYTVARLLDFGDEKKGIPSSYEFLRVCVPESEFQLWKGYPKYDAERNCFL